MYRLKGNPHNAPKASCWWPREAERASGKSQTKPNEFLPRKVRGRSVRGPGSRSWGGRRKSQEERDEGRKGIKR